MGINHYKWYHELCLWRFLKFIPFSSPLPQQQSYASFNILQSHFWHLLPVLWEAPVIWEAILSMQLNLVFPHEEVPFLTGRREQWLWTWALSLTWLVGISTSPSAENTVNEVLFFFFLTLFAVMVTQWIITCESFRIASDTQVFVED